MGSTTLILGEPSRLAKEKLKEFQHCETSDDCIFVQNGCCDCVNGGEDVAINKTRVTTFMSLRNCDGVACTEMYGECGKGKISCENGLCIIGRSCSFCAI